MARFTLTVELTEEQLPSFIQVLGKITDLLSSIKAKDIARVEYHELNLDNCEEKKSKETSLTMPTAPSELTSTVSSVKRHATDVRALAK